MFRERKGERYGGKHQCVVTLTRPLLGTWPATQTCALTGNQTFDSQASTQSIEPHQPGHIFIFFE